MTRETEQWKGPVRLPRAPVSISGVGQDASLKMRITVVMLCCIVFAGSLAIRSMMIQVWTDQRLVQMAKRQFQSKVLIRPRRGSITDRNGEPLAISTETNSLAVNPSKARGKRTLARLLAKALDLNYIKLIDKLNEKKEFAWIKRHIKDQELTHLRKWGIVDSNGDLASGLWLVRESQRMYPHQELASHLLGSVNIDSEGLEGVELWLDEKLSGKVVSVSGVRDALGRPAFLDAQAAKDVKDGESISLTIDAPLQFSVEEHLKGAIHRTGARGGGVIVMNSVTGEILAMANQPAFNPNQKDGPVDHRRNRLLTDGYEPGSTLKPVLLASALSHGWKLGDQLWAERGTFKVQGKRISEAEAHEKFDWLSLKDIIKVSSNVGAAKLALRVGTDPYFNTLRSFGFGTKTGTGFPGEISGKIPPRKGWQPLTLANIGFGQGILVTPIQMVRAYAAFLNGGWLVQPVILKNNTQRSKQDLPRRVLSQRVVEQVVESLEAATLDGGTGAKGKLAGYRVCGKTGTAQVVDPSTGTYSKSRYIVSFIGFAVQVEPKIVILAMLDEPKGMYYASDTAAPLFRDVLNAVATRFSLPAAATPFLGRQKDFLSMSQAKAVIQELVAVGSRPDGKIVWKMPTLVGLTPREAIRLLGGHAFKVEMHGVGVIKNQFPEEGKGVADGATVRLSLAEP